MTKDLYDLAYRTGGTLDCRLAFRASVKEKAMLLEATRKQKMGLGEYVIALHRFYEQENK